MSDYSREFGRHVRSLRRARGLTQEQLAESTGLSKDTVRRLEHGGFSPSVATLRKLCTGLGISLTTLFESFELGRTDKRREVFDLIHGRTDRELTFITTMIRALVDGLDAITQGVPS